MNIRQDGDASEGHGVVFHGGDRRLRFCKSLPDRQRWARDEGASHREILEPATKLDAEWSAKSSGGCLFHFSDRGDIILFEPRPVAVPAKRRPCQEWLNDALLWATDAAHAFLYLFPRECPRIIAWPTGRTNGSDRAAWFGMGDARAIAFVEDAWMERIKASSVFRYALPPTAFEDIGDTGMWVSRTAVMPTAVTEITDLMVAQARHAIELRPVPRLTALRSMWQTTLHVSGIRLRNAQDWTTAP